MSQTINMSQGIMFHSAQLRICIRLVWLKWKVSS